MMKNYVISLKNAEQRRTHITKEFGRQNIAFEFFDAITPDQVPQLAKRFSININNANLTQGELACLFSHVSLWQHALDDDLDYIGIFEDDIYLGENADKLLNDSKWLPKNGIVKVELFENAVNQKFAKINAPDGRSLRQLSQLHLGAAGYILSKQSCQFLLDFAKKYPKIIASDHIVFEDVICKTKLPVYQLTPALCVQSDRIDYLKLNIDRQIFDSSLEVDRRARFGSTFKKVIDDNGNLVVPSRNQKIKRELLRIIHQITSIHTTMFRHLFGKIGFK